MVFQLQQSIVSSLQKKQYFLDLMLTIDWQFVLPKDEYRSLRKHLIRSSH